MPEVSGEFVAAMEDVLDLYAEPYDPKRPTVTFDETSKQLIGETRQPLPAQPDPDEPKKKIWELADDEAITLVGGKLRLVTLPPSESPLALLRELEKKYPASELCPEAQ